MEFTGYEFLIVQSFSEILRHIGIGFFYKGLRRTDTAHLVRFSLPEHPPNIRANVAETGKIRFKRCGVNLEQLKDLRDATEGKCNIIASGGVHTIADIRGCKELGLYGTICGKSIYKGTLDLREAIALAEGV